jgi:hypothetical protein
MEDSGAVLHGNHHPPVPIGSSGPSGRRRTALFVHTPKTRTQRIEVQHPCPNWGLLAQLTLVVTPVRQSDYEADEIELEIVPASGFAGSNLSWQLTIRALISLNPRAELGPVQGLVREHR